MVAFRLILAICLAGLVGAASADQTDPRLDRLFDDLKSASTQTAAVPIEQEIWSIWQEVPDVAANLLMDDGIGAMSRGNYSEAIGRFDRVIAIAPDFAEAWNKRATAHYLAGNYDRSLSDIAKTLELEPRHFGALSGRGMVYVQLDDPASALASFEAALAVHPHLHGAQANAKALRKILNQRDI